MAGDFIHNFIIMINTREQIIKLIKELHKETNGKILFVENDFLQLDFVDDLMEKHINTLGVKLKKEMNEINNTIYISGATDYNICVTFAKKLNECGFKKKDVIEYDNRFYDKYVAINNIQVLIEKGKL